MNGDWLNDAITRVERKVDKARSNPAPTVPIYDVSDFPQDAVEGQIAIGSDVSLWFFKNGSWQKQCSGT